MEPSDCASFPAPNKVPAVSTTVDTAPLPTHQYPASLPPLHILTVTTHRSGYFTALVYSSTLLGANIQVFGWGQKWRGFGTKIMAMADFARLRDPGEIVMLVDGFDTVLLQPKEAIARKFLEFGNRIVVTGEATSHRWGVLKHLFRMYHDCIFRANTDMKWPKPLPYASPNLRLTLVNTGCVIGFAGDIARVFKNISHDTNDQKFLGDLYRADPYKDIVIDHNCAIFALYRSREDLKFLPFEEAEKQARHVVPHFDENGPSKRYPPAPAVMRTALRGAVLDSRTNEAPCVLHIHCRRNADWLMELLGLPLGEGLTEFRSYAWYAFFSLKGTIGADRQVARMWGSVLLTTIVTCVSIIGLVLGFVGWCTRKAATHNVTAFLLEKVIQPALNLILQVCLLVGGSQVSLSRRKEVWAASHRAFFDQHTCSLPHAALWDQREVISEAPTGTTPVPVSSIWPVVYLFSAVVTELLAPVLNVVSGILELSISLRWLFLGGTILGVAILTGMTLTIVGWNAEGDEDENPEEKKDSTSAKKKT
ncbi:hypothetical protein TGARI_253300 [Toxoplasma gondii ARI]|uniref:PLOD1-3-like GT domain-containing protein n=2 Tax=Toxoplasma gondii TaxID=5811 RepID=A0A139XSW9_TOXGO|nr:hypothetical protein TGARI_253300 [Toxoplasma gondii ARI]PIL97938.1 putative transmembrane protein [Toxoplasma gondii COUG]